MTPPRLSLRVTSQFPKGPLPDRDHDGLFAVDVLDGDGTTLGQLFVGDVEWKRTADGSPAGLTLRLPFGFTIDHQEDREVLPK